MKKILLAVFLAGTTVAFSQTVSDGLMMPKGALCTGFIYAQEQWTKYWEGELKRENPNVGTVSMRSLTWMGNYGVTNNVNVIAMIPYVKTNATGGTMHGMEGLQDISLTVKYNFFKRSFTSSTFKTFGALTFSTPLTDYTPDFFPLSLGTATTNLSYRLTAGYFMNNGFYLSGSGAYTWRSNTMLDRPSYWTNGQMYLTDEVKMPNVFDYTFNFGYHKGPIQVDLHYWQQNTLGGGDIRRQDMPFVSNRMNFSKVGAFLMYYVPKPKYLAVRLIADFTVAGRNVGQSVTAAGGLLYTLNFLKPSSVN